MLSEADYPQVIAAARSGAEWAWTEIYRDLSPGVLRYLRAHRAPDADDLLGDIFVRVVTSLGSFDGDGRDFRAWVFTIARNSLADRWRALARVRELPSDPSELPELPADADPEQDALRRSADDRVRAVLAQLSEAQRDVLILRIVGGFSIDEVARVTGRTPGAVKSLQSRGLATIRREYRRSAVSWDAFASLFTSR